MICARDISQTLIYEHLVHIGDELSQLLILKLL